MKNLALKRIQKMKPYQPPLENRQEYKGLLLDFNERTIPPSPLVIQTLKKIIQKGKLQVYPEYFDLKEKIAKYAEVKPEEVIITNGSDQAIDIIFRIFVEKKDKVIIPRPSFSMFFQSAQIAGAKIISPFYKKEDFSFPLKEVLNSIKKGVKLIVICNPNNPTGTLVSVADIEKIVRKAKNAIVFVDEAYFEFSKITAAPLIKKYPNIIISRTFSKAFGLASLRIGYILARQQYIAEMLKVTGPYDVNAIASYAALAALKDKKNMERYVKEVMEKAKPLVEKFFFQNRISYFPSFANFILFQVENAEKVKKQLEKNHIRVRLQNENTLRVSIGTASQMKKFINIYKTTILLKYVFLDRDGTLIYEPKDTHQIDKIKDLKILDGVIKGLQELIKRGYKLIIVSNQDGLGTPSFLLKNFEGPHNKMLQIFRENGITFDEIFICPHFPHENCNCRKPKTGLVDKFLRNTNIDKKWSFICGDRESDRQFAKNLGLKFFPMKTNGNFYKAIKPLLKELKEENQKN